MRGIHETFEDLEANLPEKLLASRVLGCDYMISAVPLKVDFTDPDQVRELCERLNAVGKTCREQNMRLLYHNHTMEFFRVCGGNGLDTIFQLTNPEYVLFEPCVYTMQISGADPVRWVRRLQGRMETIHIKDCVVRAVDGELLPMPVSTEPGRGNLDLGAICQEANRSGAKWYVMEIHENCINNDPFQSLKICADYFENL